MRFTDRSIRALRPKPERYDVWQDGESAFGIRVFPSGIKSFHFMYRFQGRLRRMTLGVYRHHDGPVTPSQELVGLADARVLLADAKKKLTEGIDPAEEKQKQKQADRSAETVGEIIDRYIEDHASQRSIKAKTRTLNVELRPRWGRRKGKDITRKDVIALVDAIKNRGSPVMANRTRSIVLHLFEWAVDKDILSVSPCIKIPKAVTEESRSRYLTRPEVWSFWNGLDRLDVTDGFGMEKQLRIALKFLLVTGQRRGEVAAARWSEFDFEDRIWVIPKHHTKNKRPHLVPLSHLAIQLLHDLQMIHEANAENQKKNAKKRRKKAESKEPNSKNELLFPSRIGHCDAIKPAALTRAMRNCMAAFDLEELATPHDLRRTVSTHMGRLGIDRTVREKVLNHSDHSLAAVYDVWAYADEKRDALERWAADLEAIVSSENPPSASPAETVNLRQKAAS